MDEIIFVRYIYYCVLNVIYFFRFQNVLKFTVLELVKPCRQSTLLHWSKDVQNCLLLAEVDWEFCVSRVVECAISQEMTQLMAGVTKNLIGGKYSVKSASALKAITMLLEYRHPDELKIDLPINEPTPMPELGKLLSYVKQFKNFSLSLNLQHSYYTYTPCDEVIVKLTDAR